MAHIVMEAPVGKIKNGQGLQMIERGLETVHRPGGVIGSQGETCNTQDRNRRPALAVFLETLNHRRIGQLSDHRKSFNSGHHANVSGCVRERWPPSRWHWPACGLFL